MATEADCLEALRAAARKLGKSPIKAAYEELGMTPAASTVLRVCGGWNEAKETAGLETYNRKRAGGRSVEPVPADVDLSETEWEALSGHQRWYRKNLDYSRERKRRRRQELVRWVYEYKRDNCECRECGEAHPACLDFHHPDGTDKEFSVSRRANRGHSKERIRAEMKKCVVLCSNCHRREHFEPPANPRSDSV